MKECRVFQFVTKQKMKDVILSQWFTEDIIIKKLLY